MIIINDENCDDFDHKIFSPFTVSSVNGDFPIHSHNTEKDEENRLKDVSSSEKFFVSDYEQHIDLIQQLKED